MRKEKGNDMKREIECETNTVEPRFNRSRIVKADMKGQSNKVDLHGLY